MKATLLLVALLVFLQGEEGRGHPINSRIVGGVEVSPKYKYDWIVSLTFRGYHICGGSLIDPEWVLTAAHCVVGLDVSEMVVYVHRHDVTVSPTVENSIGRSIKVAVVADKYSTVTNNRDMALFKLSSPITQMDTILLDTTGQYNVGNQLVSIIGWGAAYYDGYSTETLHYAQIRVWDFDDCNDRWGGDLNPDTMICAALTLGGVDTCQGDSGGPLIIDLDGSPIQIGVVSFGYKCAEPYAPGIYSNVYGMRDFIQKAMDPARNFTNCLADSCGGGFCYESVDTFVCRASSLPLSLLPVFLPLVLLASFLFLF